VGAFDAPGLQTAILAQLPDPSRPLDRRGLQELFRAGLALRDIALRHGVAQGFVTALVKRWDLDPSALRVFRRSVAVLRPDLAAEFIVQVDGGKKQRNADGLTLGSGRRCRWRCSSCSHEWEATVANRALNGSGCPVCARVRGRDVALSKRARTPALAVVRPDLAGEFVRNLSVPARGFDSTPAGSQDRVLWRCRYGHHWTTPARQRVKYQTNCPMCRPGFRSSRLEYDVAELLMAATGLIVLVSHVEPRSDRADFERIDLYIEELDVLVDLDPARWHRTHTAMERDARKVLRLAGRRYVRVRSGSLGLLDVPLPPGSTMRQIVAAGDDRDPETWVHPLLRVLTELSDGPIDVTLLGSEQRRQALGRASRRWASLHRESRRHSLLSEHPDIAADFVEVPERPGLTAADVAPAGDDRARWRCSACAHSWETRIANRTRGGTGCPRCRARAAGRSKATPLPGESFADVRKELLGQFVTDLSHPGLLLSDLRPNSTDNCRWLCPHCGREWETTLQARNRRPGGGCGCRRGRRGSAASRA
jgi:hypothetical protein